MDLDYRRHRRRRDALGCESVRCEHEGRCIRARDMRAGASVASVGPLTSVCFCKGQWGGSRCTAYVGHDHACLDLGCSPPALCVWDDALSGGPGVPYCACLEGTSCTAPAGLGNVASEPAAKSSAGAGAGAAVGVLVLLAVVLASLYLFYRRRNGAFVHARLPDNVEINNPMYLAGEDELDPAPGLGAIPGARHNHSASHGHHAHTNGGNHFANPVYESMYEPLQTNHTEEHANLLAEGPEGSPQSVPQPERAALL